MSLSRPVENCLNIAHLIDKFRRPYVNVSSYTAVRRTSTEDRLHVAVFSRRIVQFSPACLSISRYAFHLIFPLLQNGLGPGIL